VDGAILAWQKLGGLYMKLKGRNDDQGKGYFVDVKPGYKTGPSAMRRKAVIFYYQTGFNPCEEAFLRFGATNS